LPPVFIAQSEFNMQSRKYKVFFAFFPYGGNGGSPSEHPAVRTWFAKTLLTLKENPLVHDFCWKDFDDTPITMTRNQAVLAARQVKADILVMIDSDMIPDLYLLGGDYSKSGHAVGAKPFLPQAIDLIDQYYETGPVIVAAPYCGPPPDESPYVFVWEESPSEAATPDLKLRMMTRTEASMRTGVSSAAALPTGLIAFDVRAFKYTEPQEGGRGWFYYEFDDHYHAAKGGTEDVMATRDLSLAIQTKLGYNPLKVTWDSWAGHMKPRVVGKPTLTYASSVDARYRKAIEEGANHNERIVEIGELQPRV
jgi:hypothetical protein